VDEMFGRYRLIELIGEGGMGSVYRAHGTMMSREIAIKVLPPEFASEPMYRQRFRREAATAARLNEPHIVPIYEAGEIDGRLYLTMPIVAGVDLKTRLERDGPMTPRLAVKVIEQVAAALDAAHDAGLVHRDVKPSNVLLTANEFVYLIDFGIAHDASATKLTSAGAFLGTYAYMALERFSSRAADARADVYALACVLYECLTGQQHYPGNSLERQIAAHLTADIPKPSVVNPAVPAAFDEVVARGMAKFPDQRYQTAEQLAIAAGRVLIDAAVPAPSQAAPGSATWPSVTPPGPNFGPQPMAPPGAWAPTLPATPQYFTPVGPPWVGGSVPSRASRKGWIIAGAAAAAAILTIAIVVVIIGGPGPMTPGAQRNSTSSETSSSAPPATPMVSPDQLKSILLSAPDVSDIMGASMQSGPIFNQP